MEGTGALSTWLLVLSLGLGFTSVNTEITTCTNGLETGASVTLGVVSTSINQDGGMCSCKLTVTENGRVEMFRHSASVIIPRCDTTLSIVGWATVQCDPLGVPSDPTGGFNTPKEQETWILLKTTKPEASGMTASFLFRPQSGTITIECYEPNKNMSTTTPSPSTTELPTTAQNLTTDEPTDSTNATEATTNPSSPATEGSTNVTSSTRESTSATEATSNPSTPAATEPPESSTGTGTCVSTVEDSTTDHTPNATNSNPDTFPAVPLAAGISGGVLFILLLLVIIICCCHNFGRKKKKYVEDGEKLDYNHAYVSSGHDSTQIAIVNPVYLPEPNMKHPDPGDGLYGQSDIPAPAPYPPGEPTPDYSPQHTAIYKPQRQSSVTGGPTETQTVVVGANGAIYAEKTTSFPAGVPPDMYSVHDDSDSELNYSLDFPPIEEVLKNKSLQTTVL